MQTELLLENLSREPLRLEALEGFYQGPKNSFPVAKELLKMAPFPSWRPRERLMGLRLLHLYVTNVCSIQRSVLPPQYWDKLGEFLGDPSFELKAWSIRCASENRNIPLSFLEKLKRVEVGWWKREERLVRNLKKSLLKSQGKSP